MAATDTLQVSDLIPWSPLTATASIFPAHHAPARDDVGPIAGTVTRLVPFGLELPEREEQARP